MVFWFLEHRKQSIHVLLKNLRDHFYAPNFQDVEGAYWFEPLRPCMRASVTLCIRSRTVRDRILKFDME